MSVLCCGWYTDWSCGCGCATATGGLYVMAAVAGVASMAIGGAVAALFGGSNVLVGPADAGIAEESRFVDTGTDGNVAGSIAACADLFCC